MKWRAAFASAGLSLLFVVVYSTTNWLAGLRPDVPSWYYSWELAIPFVPIFIIPYMSIDLFFVAAPFLCRNNAELATHAKRISFSIIVAGVVFYLFPYKLGFERQPVEGWLGAIFNPFIAADAPYNTLPSLHVALRTVLAELYARKTVGAVKWGLHIWFSLIGLSTLLTHQHHLVDVVGGFVLAAYAAYLFPVGDFRLPTTPNPRIGWYYAALPIVAVGLWLVTPREGIVFLWPAIAGVFVMLGYFGLGPGIYRKAAGRHPLNVQFVLGPVMLGQRLSLVHYRRQCRPWDEVAPGVLIGRRLNAAEAREAIAAGVTAVLDVTAEFNEVTPFRTITYRNIQVLDLTAPTTEQLVEMAKFIAEQAAKGCVYTHCKIGYSRSGAAIAAYLLASGAASSVDEACARLRSVRPSIVIRPEIIVALREFLSALAKRTPALFG